MFHFSRKRWVFIFSGTVLLVTLLIFVTCGLLLVKPAEKGGKEQVVIIKDGLTLKDVAWELEKRQIISSRTLFRIWAGVKGYGRKIKAGEYRLSSGMAPTTILDRLIKGAVITHPVTIPEGFTREQIGDLLERKGVVDKEAFISLTSDPAILKKYGISGPDLEGYLYPDTYQFARGISPLSVIDTMVVRFLQVVRPLEGKIKEAGMNLKDVIILASIIEKETGRKEERPLIASVFLNRIRRKMRLESDPTVIYGIKDFDGNLKRKHLTARTPYNTYVIRGLPPGPIASPGEQAIKAVLYPAKSDYIYFVSKNDGSHYFSKTLSEHNRAVRKYQKKRRKKKLLELLNPIHKSKVSEVHKKLRDLYSPEPIKGQI